MQFIKLKEQLKGYTLFSLNDIKKIDEKFTRARLNEWQNKGYIRKIVKNFYMFTDIDVNEEILFEVANKIYAPSYISMETALSYYNLIPDSIFQITSISTRRTYNFDTNIGVFTYRKLKPSLFFGYNFVKNNEKYFKIATIEKTILDFLYLNPEIDNIKAINSLRINKQEFLLNLNKDKFKKYTEIFHNNLLSKRIKKFMEYVNSD